MTATRELTAAEARARLPELVAVFRECFTAPPWSESEEDVERFAAALAADLDTVRVLVAAGAGRVDGFALLRPTTLPLPEERAYPRVRQALGDRAGPVLAGALEVDELAVRPAGRGRGAGRALVEAATAAAGGRTWLLTAVDAADARAFYRACGWREVGESATGTQDVVVLVPGSGPAPPGWQNEGWGSGSPR